MKKTPKCTGCGGEHYKINCLKTAHKPIMSVSKPHKAKSRVIKHPKKITRSQAKENAWKAFSTYIRTRDSLLTTNTREFCICITCNERGDSQWKPYKSIQAGHAVGGRSNAILFHEEIVNGQCNYCNQKPPYGLGGDYGNYAIALVKRHGIEHVQELQRLKGTEKVYKLHDFIEIEKEYREKLLLLL